MNEAVDRLIAERERLDTSFSGSFLVSLSAHVLLVAAAVVAPLLLPRSPLLDVQSGFAVALPRGGGGVPRPPAPQPKAAPPAPAEPAPAAPPKVLKPPTEAPRPDALPEPDSRRRPPRRQLEPSAAAATPDPKATPGAGGGAATPGLEFGPPGPGVPGGTATGGDWYLAGVQQKIWLLWNQQIRSGFDHPVGVTFTILADGTVTDVRVTQESGAALLDMAAQRAILNAAPFAPLPREYGTDRKTIHAIFRPVE